MNDNNWFGTVTMQNIDEVVRLMRLYLTGKKYTTVYCYEYKRWKPEIRVHQQLRNGTDGQAISLHRRSDYAQVIVCDTYGVGGFSTSQNESKYDPDFMAPYISFEWMNMIKVTQRAPNGLLFYTVYRVED